MINRFCFFVVACVLGLSCVAGVTPLGVTPLEAAPLEAAVKQQEPPEQSDGATIEVEPISCYTSIDLDKMGLVCTLPEASLAQHYVNGKPLSPRTLSSLSAFSRLRLSSKQIKKELLKVDFKELVKFAGVFGINLLVFGLGAEAVSGALFNVVNDFGGEANLAFLKEFDALGRAKAINATTGILGFAAMSSAAVAMSVNLLKIFFQSEATLYINPPRRFFWSPFKKLQHEAGWNAAFNRDEATKVLQVVQEALKKSSAIQKKSSPTQAPDLLDKNLQEALAQTHSPYEYDLLQTAVASRQLGLAVYALQQQARPDYENLNGDTSFKLALYKGDPYMLMLLLNSPALSEGLSSSSLLKLHKIIHNRLRSLVNVLRVSHTMRRVLTQQKIEPKQFASPEAYEEALIQAQLQSALRVSQLDESEESSQAASNVDESMSIANIPENLQVLVRLMAIESPNNNFLIDKWVSASRKSDQFNTIDLNATDYNGNTALHHAIASGNLYAMDALLIHPEVNINLTNDQGLSARQLLRGYATQLLQISAILYRHILEAAEKENKKLPHIRAEVFHQGNKDLCIKLLLYLH